MGQAKMESLSQIPTAFASCSIGLPRHTLYQKVKAICQAGFNGIELSFPDLQSFASLQAGRDIAENDYSMLCEAGAEVRKLCQGHGLKIIMLQPFSNFEGWPAGSLERKNAFARARGWIDIMAAVGTDMLQVGSSDSPNITASRSQLTADLADLADMLAERGYRLAYENWCWATHAPTWKDAWTLVQCADRANIGLCLDTFQTAAYEWGDPTTSSGRREIDGLTESDLNTNYDTSMQELARTVPADKIFLLQISDAYRMNPPLGQEPDEFGLRPRGRWSHDYRPLPFDGGYLPIAKFVETILITGFRGWFSIEVFDGQFEKKFGDDLFGFAGKAMEAHHRLLGNYSSPTFAPTTKSGGCP